MVRSCQYRINTIFVSALLAPLALACTDDGGLDDAETSTSDTGAGEESETETGPMPDFGPPPDESCPSPGPWPRPEPAAVELPRFVDNDYIDLSQVAWMTKFRSSVGHDYSDEYEHCRSMKHYYYPIDEVDPELIEIYAPVDGTVLSIEDEWQGQKILIESDEHPNVQFLIFHVDIEGPLAIGASVSGGELLGTHSFGGEVYYSDIAVWYWYNDDEYRLLSFIDLLTDSAFEAYVERGVITDRADLILTKDERDAAFLCCTDGQFDEDEDPDDWVPLDPQPAPTPSLGLLPWPSEPLEPSVGYHRDRG